MVKYQYITECNDSKVVNSCTYNSLNAQIQDAENAIRKMFDKKDFCDYYMQQLISSYTKALRSKKTSKKKYTQSFNFDIGSCKKISLMRIGNNTNE